MFGLETVQVRLLSSAGMGNEIHWPGRSVSFDTPFQKDGLHIAHHSGACSIEDKTGDRAVLCDCHCGPMYYFPVSLMPKGDFVMCWVSECGRCYNQSLGYFHLRTTRPILERIDKDTGRTVLCQNENCRTCSSMAITRFDRGTSGKDKTCWYCFDCGTEFPHRNVPGLWERLLRSFRPSSCQRLSAKL
jgi:hypothetical protein